MVAHLPAASPPERCRPMDILIVGGLVLLLALLGGGAFFVLKKKQAKIAPAEPKAVQRATSPTTRATKTVASNATGLRSRKKGKENSAGSAPRDNVLLRAVAPMEEPAPSRKLVEATQASAQAQDSQMGEHSQRTENAIEARVPTKVAEANDGELGPSASLVAQTSAKNQREGDSEERLGEVLGEPAVAVDEVELERKPLAAEPTSLPTGEVSSEAVSSAAAQESDPEDGQRELSLASPGDASGIAEPLESAPAQIDFKESGREEETQSTDRILVGGEASPVDLSDLSETGITTSVEETVDSVSDVQKHTEEDKEESRCVLPSTEQQLDASCRNDDIDTKTFEGAREDVEKEEIESEKLREQDARLLEASSADQDPNALVSEKASTHLAEDDAVAEDDVVAEGNVVAEYDVIAEDGNGEGVSSHVVPPTVGEVLPAEGVIDTRGTHTSKDGNDDAETPYGTTGSEVGVSADHDSVSSSELMTEAGSSDSREEKSEKAKKEKKHKKKHRSKHRKEKKEKSAEGEEGNDEKSARKEKKHKHKHKHRHLVPEDGVSPRRTRSSSSARRVDKEGSADDAKHKQTSGEEEEKKKKKKDKKKRLSSIAPEREKSPSAHKHKHKHRHQDAEEAGASPPAVALSPQESPTKKSKRISLIGKNLLKKKLGRLSSLTGKQAQQDIRAMHAEDEAKAEANVAQANVAKVHVDPPLEAKAPGSVPVTTVGQREVKDDVEAGRELQEEPAALGEEIDVPTALGIEDEGGPVHLAEAGKVSESLAELMEAASGVTLSYSNLPEVTEDMLELALAKPQPSLPAASLSELLGNTGLPPIPTKAKRSSQKGEVAPPGVEDREEEAPKETADRSGDKEVPQESLGEAGQEQQQQEHEDKHLLFEPLYNCWDDVATSNPTAEWVTIVDNGTYALKGGCSGHFSPSVLVPPIAARPRAGSRTSMLGPNETVVYGKDAIMAIERHLEQATPFRDGVITEWDDMQTLWERAFRSINVDLNNTGHSLLLTAPSSTDFAKLGEVAFEYFGVPSVNVVSQEQAALASTRSWNGVSINLGASTATVAPILFGCEVKHAVRGYERAHTPLTLPMACFDTCQAAQLGTLSERNKQRLACFVKETEISVALPDGSCPSQNKRMKNEIDVEGPLDTRFASILVPKDCTAGAEVLFSPVAACGPGVPGLPALVVEAVMACDTEARLPLLNNVFLSGGSSQLPGLCERLEHEIRKRLPEALRGAAVRVSRAQHPQLAAYNGCRNLAHAPFYPLQCATIEAYHEIGAASVVRRFG